MSDDTQSFPRYITYEIEFPLYRPGGSEVLEHTIDMGELAIDRLADLLRTGTPENPSQTIPELRRELRLDRLSEIAGDSKIYEKYAQRVENIVNLRTSIINSSRAVNGKEGEVATFLTQALGRIEDAVRSLNEGLESATTGSGNRIALHTEAELIDAIFKTVGTVADEVRAAADRLRDVIRDIDWYSQVHAG
ncbi:hypothetical protein [Nocardia pneumoniae]|uniref:hypothetical protein n=1 Tax=Nocardia pneumoniae TaxID=228601 RepID=UPI0012F6462E|nr:hypothetical protein [Nocardia pneumoniae]